VNFPLVPISFGELLDKITILQIKSQNSDSAFVQKELQDLIKIAKDFKVYDNEYIEDLLEVNQTLWNIEDRIRQCEKNKEFGEEFINLARQVYINNDKRYSIKKKINEQTNSNYQEIKVY